MSNRLLCVFAAILGTNQHLSKKSRLTQKLFFCATLMARPNRTHEAVKFRLNILYTELYATAAAVRFLAFTFCRLLSATCTNRGVVGFPTPETSASPSPYASWQHAFVRSPGSVLEIGKT